MSDDCFLGRPAGTLAGDDCVSCQGDGCVPHGPPIVYSDGLVQTPLVECLRCHGTGRNDE